MAIQDGYCSYHKSLGINRDKPSVIVDKFNSQGFKSEIELFKYVWENRKVCFVTGKKLEKYQDTDFFLNLFAHILSKKNYPEFRLYSNNIAVVDPVIHAHYDNPVLEKILEYEHENNCSFAVLFDLEEDLLKQYVTEFKKKRKPRPIIEAYRKAKI